MRKKILIVDDSRVFLTYMGLLLKRLNYDVVEAESGIRALQLLSDMTPDLVMIDVHMEMVDGLKLLRHIKTDKVTSGIPVIMVSIDSGTAIIEQCKNSGCSHYLTKPLKVGMLHEVLSRCLFQREGHYRKHLRIPFHKPVVVSYKGQQHELVADNLSESGIYIKTETPFTLGSEVVIMLVLDNNVSLRVRGAVLYRNEPANGRLTQPPGMAIEFAEMKEDDSLSLRNFIENNVAEDIFESQEDSVLSR